MNKYKKFITPREFMRKFNVEPSDYHSLVIRGLPTYNCAGIRRHPIDEIYLWCEENRIMLEDRDDWCNATELAKVFSVSVTTIAKWERMGMPKKVIPCSSRGNKKFFAYNPDEVLTWLRSLHEGIKV